MCDLDTPLNGLLLHSDTLCVLSYGGPEDPYEDGQEATQEDGQESSQYDEEEEENEGEETPGGGTAAGSSGTTAPGPVSTATPHAGGIDRYRGRGMGAHHAGGATAPATAETALRDLHPVPPATAAAVPTGTGGVG